MTREVIIKCSDECRGGKNIYGEPITEVVRCKDCRWYSVKGKTTMYGWCDANWISVNETDYCSKGERQRNYFGERKEP